MRSRSTVARKAEPEPAVAPVDAQSMETRVSMELKQPELPLIPADVEPPAVDKPAAPFAAQAMPSMGAGYERIITKIFDVGDPEALYEVLREGLQSAVRPSASDYGTIVDDLDTAERNAQCAVELLVNAQLAYEIFDLDAQEINGALRDRARQQLEGEKEAGDRKKSITEADVNGAVVGMFPDEARELAGRRERAKGAVEVMRSLANRWQERARDLRVMTQTARGT